MTLIGTIPYSTLDEGEVKTWDAIDILFDTSSNEGLAFRKSPHLDPKIKEELRKVTPHFARVIKALHLLSPLFGKTYFDIMIFDMLRRELYIESREVYFMKGRHKYTLSGEFGTHECYDHEMKNGEILPAGAYVRIEREELDLSITHELFHILHAKACELGFIDIRYLEYEDVPAEAIAMMGERVIQIKDFSKEKYPYNTAFSLLNRLDRVQQYRNKPFHERWEELLVCRKKEDLEEHVERLEREFIPHIPYNSFQFPSFLGSII